MSKQSMHTDGPWSVGEGRVGIDGDEIPVYDKHGICICAAWPIGEDFDADVPTNALANAQLLSTAPELLVALSDLLARVREGCPQNEVAITRSIAQAQVAIDKATLRLNDERNSP